MTSLAGGYLAGFPGTTRGQRVPGMAVSVIRVCSPFTRCNTYDNAIPGKTGGLKNQIACQPSRIPENRDPARFKALPWLQTKSSKPQPSAADGDFLAGGVAA